MKISLKIGIILLVILSSCSSSIKDSDFIGKWSIIEYNTDNTKGLSKELIKGAKDIAINSTYLLNEDNTFSSKIDKASNQGTWDFNLDSKTLSLNGFEKRLVVVRNLLLRRLQRTRYTQPKRFLVLDLLK